MQSTIEFPLPNLKPALMLVYSTNNLSKKDKVRFFYALNGRNKKPGILKKCDAIHVGITVILAEKPQSELLVKFFMQWKIPFKITEMLIE